MSENRDRLLALIKGDSLSESQVGELAVAVDLLLSKGSSDHFAAVKLLRELLEGAEGISAGATADAKAPVFDLGTMVILDASTMKTGRDEYLDVNIDPLWHGPAHPRYVKCDAPLDTTVQLFVNGESQWAAPWRVAELSRWTPFNSRIQRSAWNRSHYTMVQWLFAGVLDGSVSASIAMEFE